MTWTTERPTEPGWYWWRGHPDYNGKIGYLTDSKVIIFPVGSGHIDEMGGEWAGPIQKPED